MRKILLALFFCFGVVASVRAQVTAVTVTGVSASNFYPGQSVAVTFTVVNTNIFSTITYDVLFSAATTASASAYSSYIAGPMVCLNTDTGYNFNSGLNLTNTYVQTVVVPASSYSGNIVVIAGENQNYLTCSSPTAQNYLAFTILNTPTATNTTTNTPTPTPTNTTTTTATNTTTNTATATAHTPTATNTTTNTPTNTTTSTTTNTPTLTTTSTPTLTVTPSPTNSYTTTATPALTQTPVFLPVGGQLPSGPSHQIQLDAYGNIIISSLGTSPTPTVPYTFTPTNTFTPQNTLTPTNTYTRTNTYTPTATFTGTNGGTPNPNWTKTKTYTPTPVYTSTPTFTYTSSFTPTVTMTPTNTATFTPVTAAQVAAVYTPIAPGSFTITSTTPVTFVTGTSGKSLWLTGFQAQCATGPTTLIFSDTGGSTPVTEFMPSGIFAYDTRESIDIQYIGATSASLVVTSSAAITAQCNYWTQLH